MNRFFRTRFSNLWQDPFDDLFFSMNPPWSFGRSFFPNDTNFFAHHNGRRRESSSGGVRIPIHDANEEANERFLIEEISEYEFTRSSFVISKSIPLIEEPKTPCETKPEVPLSGEEEGFAEDVTESEQWDFFSIDLRGGIIEEPTPTSEELEAEQLKDAILQSLQDQREIAPTVEDLTDRGLRKKFHEESLTPSEEKRRRMSDAEEFTNKTRNRRIKELYEMFETEPMDLDDSSSLTRLTVILPNGITQKRAFSLDEPVQKLRDFVDYLLLSTRMTEEPDFFEIIMSSFPHKTLIDMNQTFRQAKLYPNIAVTVRQIL